MTDVLHASAAPRSEFRGTSRFRIVKRLGGGATGDIFEAVDAETQSRVALKTLRVASPDLILLLKREFRGAQDLRHPNLVRLGELLEEAGQWFFTMELVDGGTNLLDYVRRGARLAPYDEALLRHALRQLVSGLRALHAADKVHRDIKPPNVLVTREGRVVIVDFGIVADTARHSHGGDGQDDFVGTPFYMAPEQVLSSAVGPAADWYAVGVILYEALTGQLPFSGTVSSVMERKVAEIPAPPRALSPGVPPDLDALCVDLLAIEPDDRPRGDDIARRLGVVRQRGSVRPAARPRSDRPFVGRSTEVAALDDAFEAMRGGQTVVLLVEGESGVGKTALVDHFVERQASAMPDLVLLRGRCFERESVPYKAVDDVVDTLAQFLQRCPPEMAAPLLPDDLETLCRSFPVFATALPEGTAPPSGHFAVASPREQRARLFGAMRQLLCKLGSLRPVVVVIDDMHWADTDSIGLLSEVLRPPAAPRLLLVSTMRSETAVRAQARDISRELGRTAADVRMLHLTQLPDEEAIALARALAGERTGTSKLDESFVRQVLAESHGHPLFIDEMVSWRTSGSVEGVPVHLDDIVWQRARMLDSAAQRFLELTAVAGVPIPEQVVSAAAVLDRALTQTVVDALQHARLIRTSGDRAARFVQPYHDRIRESVVNHMSADAVRATHAQLAIAAEQSGHADADFLFTHWEGAGNPSRAAEYARLAGDHAAGALAFVRAAALYRRTLELGPQSGDARRVTQQRLAEALTNAGYEAEAAEVRLELARGAEPLAAVDLRRHAAEQFLTSGQFERGKTLFRDVLRAMNERFPDSRLSVVFWFIVVRLRLWLHGLHFPERSAPAEDKVALVRIDALWSAANGFAMTDTLRGAYFQTKTLLLAMRARDLHRSTIALAKEAGFRASNGMKQMQTTRAHLAAARSLGDRAGWTPYTRALLEGIEGYASYFSGDWARAIEQFVRSEAIYRDKCIGFVWELSLARTMLYRALTFAGRIEELRQRHDAVLRDAAQRGDVYTVVNIKCSAAFLVALADDRAADARRVLDEVKHALPAGHFLMQHYYHLLAQIQVDLYDGRVAHARSGLHAAMPRVRRSLLSHIQSFKAMTRSLLARCALACAEADPAGGAPLIAEARREIEQLRRSGATWSAAAATLHQAGALACEGARDDAVKCLRTAIDDLDRAGLKSFATAGRRRLGKILAGSEGAALLDAARAVEAAEGIVDPEAFTRLHAPGFGRLER